MIVKIKRNEYGGWSYFEAPVIHVTKKYGKLKDIIGLGENVVIWTQADVVDKEPLLKTIDIKTIEQDIPINYKRISLETTTGHLRTIITNSICYVLNENGKTIDKL